MTVTRSQQHNPHLTSSLHQRVLLTLAPTASIHYTFKQDDIHNLFDGFGHVQNVQVFYYPTNPEVMKVAVPSLAFAMVDLPAATLNAALEHLSGYEIPGIGTIHCQRVTDETLAPIMAARDAYEHLYPLMNRQSSSSDTSSSIVATVGAPPAHHQQSQSVNLYSPITYLCRIEMIALFGLEGFDTAAEIMGPSSQNIHYVVSQTENCVTISLKGIPLNEAPVAERLHMSIRSSNKQQYEKAVEMCEDLLQCLCIQFVEKCLATNTMVPAKVGFVRHNYLEEENSNVKYVGKGPERAPVWLDRIPSHMIKGSRR